MDTKTLEKIFNPFFTTKDVNEGTGLGLSIVHGIIKDMQGQIIVKSQHGKGTTFRILLPVSAEKKQSDLTQQEASKHVQGIRVLFVDDDELISRAGKRILEDKGYVVALAKNGLEGLKVFQKDILAFDLIITDLTMPRMTGLELGKAVRKLSSEVQIVLTSGILDPKLQSEFESLGFNGFVRKPWTAAEMLEVISSLDIA
ncbi:MAG: response regulator [Candidatus Marinimicrobia bacterium]|nr:response regulator [Candidatus Neomarinimicrobiota bacterium]MCF7851510.1 response regulator [Candidatus Neomarinimicrobiota bacterium]